MGVTLRPSSSALAAVGRVVGKKREEIAADWAAWVHNRLSAAIEGEPPLALARQLSLLVDILTAMTGSSRRPANDLWLTVSEWYGRTAADRGLASGEIVEEFQYLRELLIRTLSEVIAAMPARQSMATFLRLNRVLDNGLAHAVVGYTDALIETLLNRQGVPVSAADVAEREIEKNIDRFSKELRQILQNTPPDGVSP